MDTFFAVYSSDDNYCSLVTGAFFIGAYRTKESAQQAINEYTSNFNKFRVAHFRLNSKLRDNFKKLSENEITEMIYEENRGKILEEDKNILNWGNSRNLPDPNSLYIEEKVFDQNF